MVDKFLDDESPLRPVITKTPPLMTDAGPVAPYVRDTGAPPLQKLTPDIGIRPAVWIVATTRWGAQLTGALSRPT